MWEVGAQIEAGRLVRVLDQYAAPGNDIYAVFAQRRHLPLRTRAFVEFLRRAYAVPEYWRRGTGKKKSPESSEDFFA
jgi:DNA-binding transcriptional LysR family regulator